MGRMEWRQWGLEGHQKSSGRTISQSWRRLTTECIECTECLLSASFVVKRGPGGEALGNRAGERQGHAAPAAPAAPAVQSRLTDDLLSELAPLTKLRELSLRNCNALTGVGGCIRGASWPAPCARLLAQ